MLLQQQKLPHAQALPSRNRCPTFACWFTASMRSLEMTPVTRSAGQAMAESHNMGAADGCLQAASEGGARGVV